MSDFGWTRLAYLTAILAVLAVLVKLGTFGAASIPESLPESAFAFAHREPPVFEEHLDWGSRAEEHSETTTVVSRDEEHDFDHDEDREHDHDHSHEPVESIYESVNFEEDAPVFYRPAPRVSGAFQNPSKEKSCRNLEDAPPGSEILFPVAREYFDSYDDTWGAARPQGGHEGTDLMVPNGTPLLAMTDARVVPVSGANGNGWNTLGGYTVMLEAAYSVGPVRKGDLFYYAHLDRKSELRVGDAVKSGDVVGYAGDTGQGPEGARGQFPPHLHLGWYELGGERTQLASGAMNPYPLLEWVKANGGSISGGSDIPYCEAPQPATPTPSTGGYWQFPSSPGVRPDIDTGTNSAAPTPTSDQTDSAELSPDVTREKRRPPVRPPKPADPPPEETDETTAPQSPVLGIPSLPNPLPGIGDLIGDILNPPEEDPPPEEPPEPEEEPEPPVPPDPEETTPEDTDPEETPECEAHEHGDEEETNEDEPRAQEECHEETTPEEDPPLEETDPETIDEETTSEETVEESTGPAEGQYESNEPKASSAGPTVDQYESDEPETSTEETEAPDQEPTSGP
ncbi:MAG: peptidoglycan DD-metalloendopeptidase family protein [Rubrobacteraceae bacterium]